MSHPTKVPGKIKSLKLLSKAVAKFGGKVDETTKTYAGWGGSRIKCDASITNPACQYEVGLHKTSTKKDGEFFEMKGDLWGGHLEKVYGKDFSSLNKAYAEERIKAALRGARITKRTEVGQDLLLTVSK